MKKILLLLSLLTLLALPAWAEEPAADEVALVDDVELTALTPLPIDFSGGHVPAEEGFTFADDGSAAYEDASLTVRMERREIAGDLYNIAWVTVADPSQLRTGTAGRGTSKISVMAARVNAVVAIGSDYYGNGQGGYVVRQGEVLRKNPYRKRDMLVVDANGDFHILQNSDAKQLKALVEGEVPLVNVFNFGPALVIDGEKTDLPKDYGIGNIHGIEPRCAIGQLGDRQYLLVVVDGRRANSDGCTVASLQQFMYEAGCTQAYNLDGGNSALMVFHGENYSNKSVSAERDVSDFIYFATLVDFGLDGE